MTTPQPEPCPAVDLSDIAAAKPRVPSPCYSYIWDQYGLAFRVGDIVKVTEPGVAETGRLGSVVAKTKRLHYVAVRLNGESHAGEWHPGSLEVQVEPARPLAAEGWRLAAAGAQEVEHLAPSYAQRGYETQRAPAPSGAPGLYVRCRSVA
jgi:hypothetical protein